MNYKINPQTDTVTISKVLTTNEIGSMLNELLMYEREKDIKYINWKFKYAKKTTSTSITR
jgi:hypothetical protein